MTYFNDSLTEWRAKATERAARAAEQQAERIAQETLQPMDRESERAWDEFVVAHLVNACNEVWLPQIECMSSDHFGQLAWQFKRMSGSSG